MVALQAMKVPDDSSLKNPEQIPFPKPPPLVQNPSCADNEEDTPSMKELVQEIDSHVKSIDLEVTSTCDVALHIASLPPLNSGAQPAEDLPTPPPSAVQPVEDAPSQSAVETDPATQA